METKDKMKKINKEIKMRKCENVNESEQNHTLTIEKSDSQVEVQMNTQTVATTQTSKENNNVVVVNTKANNSQKNGVVKTKTNSKKVVKTKVTKTRTKKVAVKKVVKKVLPTSNINCKTKAEFQRTLKMGELIFELLTRSKLPVKNFRINGVYFGKRHLNGLVSSKVVEQLVSKNDNLLTELALGVK